MSEELKWLKSAQGEVPGIAGTKGDKKMVSPREMIDMNMEELCEEATSHNWDMQTLQAWSYIQDSTIPRKDSL